MRYNIVLETTTFTHLNVNYDNEKQVYKNNHVFAIIGLNMSNLYDYRMLLSMRGTCSSGYDKRISY